jgi:hypothetical protein
MPDWASNDGDVSVGRCKMTHGVFPVRLPGYHVAKVCLRRLTLLPNREERSFEAKRSLADLQPGQKRAGLKKRQRDSHAARLLCVMLHFASTVAAP